MAKKKAKKAKKAARARQNERAATGVPSMKLKEFLDNVHAHALAKAEAGAATGACLVTDPQTGQTTCVLTDQVTCTKGLGGKFIGGPCGP